MASENLKQQNYFWTDEETIFMLQQLKELNILKFIDGRRTRNAHLFQKVARRLKEAGFVRTEEQIRVRWKHVRQSYNAAKKNKQTSGQNVVVRPYSDILEELLGSRHLSRAGDHGFDIGFRSESGAGVEDFEEATMEEQSPEGPSKSETDDDSLLSFPTLSELASNRERSSTPQLEKASRSRSPQLEKASRSRSPQLERATSTPPIHLPGTRSQRSRKRRRVADLHLVFQRIDEMNNSWSQHLQRSDERMERLVSSIIQSNATIVSALLEGIRSLRPSVTPLPG